jgi:hypothetical protein
MFDMRQFLSFPGSRLACVLGKDFLYPCIRVAGSRCLPWDQSIGSDVSVYGFGLAHVSAFLDFTNNQTLNATELLRSNVAQM